MIKAPAQRVLITGATCRMGPALAAQPASQHNKD